MAPGPGFVSYSADADQQFRKSVDKALKVTDDLHVPFASISKDFYRTQTPIFKMGSAGPYPDLSEQYKRRKRAKVGSVYPILKFNGYLEVAASIEFGAGNITKIGTKNVEFGVDDGAVPYAKYHQTGTGKMPMRKFLFIGPEEKKFANSDQQGRIERWLGILNGFLLGKLQQTGMGTAK